MNGSLFEIELKNADGSPETLRDYKGNVLLLVNVASQCGLTPQYKGLEELYRRYHDRGFFVMAFPSNDFGGQEPGTMEEIQQFCSLNYDVTFPIYHKLHTLGPDKHPLYVWLTEHAEPGDEVSWNFEKFLISRDGEIAARFSPRVTPNDEELIQAIERELG
ncbi:glutathione peroxidase [Paenibacillus sp. J31TS4]|nr:glutathione peroxidase [Paenibacillus sp. J31TS4]